VVNRRIFADPAWFSAGAKLCPLLVPWGQEFIGSDRFPFCQDPYVRSGRSYFTRTSPAECDLVVCPSAWQSERDNDLVRRLANQAKVWGKPLVVFCEADTEAPFPVSGALVFRGSLRRSQKLPFEIPAPAFIRDHLADLEPVASVRPRPKGDQPVVGFCGCVDPSAGTGPGLRRVLSRAANWGLLARPRLERLLRRCGVRLTRSEGKRTRFQAVGTVAHCPRIRQNFKLRDQFLNGMLQLPEPEQRAHWESSFAEFRDNVLGSDYTLCPRGGGNWSYRFYETLCLGRVPVFFNTDCALPYESLIPWREYCVWVEGDALEQTPEAILRHYRSQTAESFVDLQRRCRKLWLDFLSLDGFFRNFHRHEQLQASQPVRTASGRA
jgi:hypothetical protein